MRRGDLVVALVALVAMGLVPAPAGEAASCGRAYYLFLAGAPQGCEDCFVERDSIWKVERGVALAAADVSVRERIVRLRGRRYRYQEVATAEVLRLLEKPEGTLPVHRVMPIPDKTSLEDLVAALRCAS